MRLGTQTPSEFRLGSTAITSLNLGSVLVWQLVTEPELPLQAYTSGLPVLSFTRGTAISSVNLAQLYYIIRENTLTYQFIDPLPTGLTLSPAGVLSGTPTNLLSATNFTLRGTDTYGRTTDLEVNITIVSSAAAVNPVFNNIAVAQTAGSLGLPDRISGFTYNYTGSQAVTLYAALTNTATVQTKANIKAGTGGGVLQTVAYPNYNGGTVDLDGFTNEAATHLQFFAEELSNGGSSSIIVVELTEVDFTKPTPPAIFTDAISGTTITLLFNDEMFGSTNTSFWSVPGRTVTGVNVGVASVILTVSPAFSASDVLTVSYTPGDIRDERGNLMDAFVNLPVENNLVLTGWSATETSGGIVINSQPSVPATPIATGGSGSITITG
jgi:hypothetical protein